MRKIENGICVRHVTKRSLKTGAATRLQVCACGASREVVLHEGVDARVAGAVVSATPWVPADSDVNDAALERHEAEVGACRCCRHARNDDIDYHRDCPDCGHQNESWAHACHECGEELDDPAETPRWVLADMKADYECERGDDR